MLVPLRFTLPMQSDTLRSVQPGFSTSGKHWQLDARGSPGSINFPSKFSGTDKKLLREDILPLVSPCLEVWEVWKVLIAVRSSGQV